MKTEKQKKYNVDCVCHNCDHHQTVEVPFGTEKKDALNHTTCDSCGCSTLTPCRSFIPKPYKYGERDDKYTWELGRSGLIKMYAQPEKVLRDDSGCHVTPRNVYTLNHN